MKRTEKAPANPELTRRIQELIKFKGGGYNEHEVADIIESQFADVAENQPELMARHCTEAGQIEKAVGLWGKAGQRSLERSALVEAAEQLTRALNQIATLPATPALRGNSHDQF